MTNKLALSRCPSHRIVTFILICVTMTYAAPFVHAQSTRRANSATPRRTARQSVTLDREIARMATEVDPRRIERTVRRLVSFGTRNTLSVQDDPKRGIGAARDYLRDEFQQISLETGGRLQVRLQTFEQPVANRIPRPTIITNVIATLPGTLTRSNARTYVVSGHYDSMCTSPTDAECDAPGANDDASGVAAVVELARVMSKRRFDGTIIFMAVAGEEQGLLGATYFAKEAKDSNMNIEAMFTNDIVGNSLSDAGVRDNRTVRVFAEGVPSNETPEQATTRRSVGGENDSPCASTRTLHQRNGRRLFAECARDNRLSSRPLRARRRPHSVSRTGLRGGALFRTERRLPPSTSKRPHRKRHGLWRFARIC
jgi:hypothetical protein